MRKKLSYFLIVILCLSFVSFDVQAVVASTTLSLTNTSGDAVQINVTGQPSESIRLSFLPSGASTLSTITLGTTDSSGNFSTLISSGGYGIPAGSPVYATVDGVQSATTLWPSYSSTISLDKTNAQIAVGQSIIIKSSSSLILAANSLTSSISTAISGSQITVTGLSLGSGTLTLCGSSVGCDSVSITVGENSGQTELTLSDNNITLNNKESATVTIFGGGNSGYTIKSNTNSSAVEASISGSSDQIALFGNSAGSATINVCSAEDDTNCINLYVTALSATENSLAFSQNNINLIPGLSSTITVSGGGDSAYYISSNTKSAVATASVSGTSLKVTGGSTTGSTVIKVCSATENAVCSDLYVSNNADSTTASDSVIAFSQNVVSVSKNSSTNVTISGGDGSGYSVSSNSNSDVVTPSINSGSNIISFYGDEEGSSVVEVCAISANSVCASLYVNVGPEAVPITFSTTYPTLASGQKLTVIVTGGTEDNVIYSISNADAVTASINNDGNVLVLEGGTVEGTSVIRVCDDVDSSNCADLTAELVISDDDVDSNDTTDTDDDNSSSSSTDKAATQLAQILVDKALVYAQNIDEIIASVNSTRDTDKEDAAYEDYIEELKADISSTLSDSELNRLKIFITYGTVSTRILGEGERAGVLGSYKKAFGKLPKTEEEWSDAIKIANGRWPSEESEEALAEAKVEFKKVYLREADMSNPNDNAAVSVIAYGLRPSDRNMDSEKAAIKSFRYIYGHDPVSSLAWDIVRAIAYSGASR